MMRSYLVVMCNNSMTHCIRESPTNFKVIPLDYRGHILKAAEDSVSKFTLDGRKL